MALSKSWVKGVPVLLFGLLLAAHGSALPAAFAEEQQFPTVKRVGFISQDRLFHDYERTKSSMAKLKELSDAKKAERDKMVAEIKGMRDELVLLNPESRAERQQAIDEKMKALAAFDQGAKETFRRQEEENVKTILEEIESVASSFAKERGFDLILSDRAVIYGADAIDVTDEILTRLNDKYAKQRP
ncbi:MAG: OmpH family outer membrane protein [Candidatus Omnitrophica bacterium]|nr:OmpH family outer membrane protein [Candidatus Omnitrophota bacterium]